MRTRYSLSIKEFITVCLMLFYGTWGYVPILMPSVAGAQVLESQQAQTHSINHIVLFAEWVGIAYLLYEVRFKLAWGLTSVRLALIYIGYSVLSILWSANTSSAVSTCLSLFFTTILAIYLASTYSAERLTVLLSWLGMMLSGLSAVFALLLPSYGIDHFNHVGAWQGIYAQKNSLGVVMVYMTGIALALQPVTFLQKVWKAIVFTLCFAEAILSASREAWIGCAILLLLQFGLYVYSRFAVRSRVPLLAMALTAIGTAIAAGVALFVYIVTALGRDITLSGRTPLWEAVIDQCKTRPLLGFGLNSFWGSEHAFPVNMAIHWVATSAHDGYLECVLELGLVGLMFLLLVIGSGYINMIKVLARVREIAVARAWIYSVLAVTLFNLTGNMTGISNSISWVLLVSSCCMLERLVLERSIQNEIAWEEEESAEYFASLEALKI